MGKLGAARACGNHKQAEVRSHGLFWGIRPLEAAARFAFCCLRYRMQNCENSAWHARSARCVWGRVTTAACCGYVSSRLTPQTAIWVLWCRPRWPPNFARVMVHFSGPRLWIYICRIWTRIPQNRKCVDWRFKLWGFLCFLGYVQPHRSSHGPYWTCDQCWDKFRGFGRWRRNRSGQLWMLCSGSSSKSKQHCCVYAWHVYNTCQVGEKSNRIDADGRRDGRVKQRIGEFSDDWRDACPDEVIRWHGCYCQHYQTWDPWILEKARLFFASPNGWVCFDCYSWRPEILQDIGAYSRRQERRQARATHCRRNSGGLPRNVRNGLCHTL